MLPLPPRQWQATPGMQLLAAFIGVGPLYALAFFGGMTSGASPLDQMPTAADALLATVLDVAVFGSIIVVALIVLCGEQPWQLNLKHGTFLRDLLLAGGLFAGLLLSLLLLGQLLSLLGYSTVPDTNLELGRALSNDPALSLVFFGPVLWLKAAFLEELSRVFLLSRLWHVFPGRIDKFAALLLSSILFGLAHIWQGPAGILGTTVIGFVLGLHYLRHGRVLPLMLVHGLYDSMVMAGLIYLARHPELLPAR